MLLHTYFNKLKVFIIMYSQCYAKVIRKFRVVNDFSIFSSLISYVARMTEYRKVLCIVFTFVNYFLGIENKYERNVKLKNDVAIPFVILGTSVDSVFSVTYFIRVLDGIRSHVTISSVEWKILKITKFLFSSNSRYSRLMIFDFNQ